MTPRISQYETEPERGPNYLTTGSLAVDRRILALGWEWGFNPGQICY
jgi:hypothetical protein